MGIYSIFKKQDALNVVINAREVDNTEYVQREKHNVHYSAEHKGTEIFNLGTGTGYSVLDIVKAFIKVNNIDLPYVIKERRPGDIAECYADASKAKEKLGWVAEKSLEDMCRDSWNWQSNNVNGYK